VRHWEQGPGRPISEPLPFGDHRTMGHVMRIEKAQMVRRITAKIRARVRRQMVGEQAAAQFNANSFA
jgi:hypothetical protein